MGLGAGKGETKLLKQLLRLLGGESCRIGVSDALQLAEKSEFVVEDAMLSFYPVLKDSTSFGNLSKRIYDFYSILQLKHRDAVGIVLGFDDPNWVPESKKIEQKSRDKNPFSRKEIELWANQFMVSNMLDGKEPTPQVLNILTEGIGKGKNKFKKFMERFLDTRHLKPDAFYAVAMSLVQSHSTNWGSSTIYLDGVPELHERIFTEEEEEVRWTDVSFQHNIMDGNVDASPVVPFDITECKNVRNTSVLFDPSCVPETGLYRLDPTGQIYHLPEHWRMSKGESDTKLAYYVCRYVKQVIRTCKKTEKEKNNNEELPVVWVTMLDTDSLVIFLIVLDYLLDFGKKTPDFRLILDTSTSYHKSQPFEDIENYEDAMEQRQVYEHYRKIHAVGHNKYILGCKEVWDMNEMYKSLRSILDNLPGSNPKTSVLSFLTMVITRGTDFVTPLGDIPIKNIIENYFAGGGYLFLQKAVYVRMDFDNPLDCFRVNQHYLKEFLLLCITMKIYSGTTQLPFNYIPHKIYRKERRVTHQAWIEASDKLIQVTSKHTSVNRTVWDIFFDKKKGSPIANRINLSNYISHLKKAKEDYHKARDKWIGLLKKAPETLSSIRKSSALRRGLRTQIFSTEQLDKVCKKYKRDMLQTSLSFPSAKRKKTPVDEKQRFKKRMLSSDGVQVWTSVIHYNMDYWCHASTTNLYCDRSLVKHRESGKSITGFEQNYQGKVVYTENVHAL